MSPTSAKPRSHRPRQSADLKPRPLASPKSPQSPDSPSQIRHQRFVLSDPVAFAYLAEDPSTTVLDRSRQLSGYQIYVVEQWACSRTHPTFVITAFTGDSSHTIQVGIISVPADEGKWSPRLRVYFKTLAQYYARRRETDLGSMMVTNLSTFPSSLTIVLVPDGNLRKHREDFFVSEDLKRLGCSGRVGLSIAPPTLPTQAKFHQLYRVSDRIDFYSAVIELVKLCQVALVLFGCLDPEYADGLLCDVTERATNEWWLRIGTDMYGVEPTDGVLGHTTVAGLLGTLIGARNRLASYGAPVSKDVFAVETTTKAISYFQKAQRIHRSRRLDRATLDRLQRATAKQASGDGWAVPKAVKSTVAELSGKGGEMIVEMVGKADKANIAEIESVDIDRFAQLVRGERARWLWHGKSRKRTTRDLFSEKSMNGTGGGDPKEAGNATDEGAAPESQRQPTELPKRSVEGNRPGVAEDTAEMSAEHKGTAFRRAKGRIKGAVGRQGHKTTRSKDSAMNYEKAHPSAENLDDDHDGTFSPASPRESEDMPRQQPNDDRDEALEQFPAFTKTLTQTPTESRQELPPEPFDRQPELGAPFDYDSDTLSKTTTINTEGTNLLSELEQNLPEFDRPTHIGHLLRRTQSCGPTTLSTPSEPRPNLHPRQLSYSIAETTINSSSLLSSASTPAETPSNPKASLLHQLTLAEDARTLRSHLAHLSTHTAPWVLRTLFTVNDLDTLSAQDLEQLHSIYYPRRDEHTSLQDGAREIVAEERSRLTEGVREVETLGAKLEYEISALRDKVGDVEEAVRDFERRVGYTEGRVGELVGRREQGVGWGSWLGGWFGGRKDKGASEASKVNKTR